MRSERQTGPTERSRKTDREVKLGVVIGKQAKHISEEEAHDDIAGDYLIYDESERAGQREGTGQWVRHTSADMFGPIGPRRLTWAEIEDWQNLTLWLDVNGEAMQRGVTLAMVLGVAGLVSDVFRYMSLQPGGVISTGSPPGAP